MFDRLLNIRNDVGLLSEEYDPVEKRLLGNFPQAFSHVGLVNTALNLSPQTLNPLPARSPALAGVEAINPRRLNVHRVPARRNMPPSMKCVLPVM